MVQARAAGRAAGAGPTVRTAGLRMSCGARLAFLSLFLALTPKPSPKQLRSMGLTAGCAWLLDRC